MKNEIKNVNLSFCCKEDWSSFKSIDERTRFCQSCKHQVVDFTKATQSDFDEAMNAGKKVCGRFKRSQMSETFLKLAAAVTVAASSAALTNCAKEKSIEPQAPVQTITTETVDEELMGDIVVGITEIPPQFDSTSLRIIPKIIPDSLKQKAGNDHH